LAIIHLLMMGMKPRGCISLVSQYESSGLLKGGREWI
jgi:hypothetical protein